MMAENGKLTQAQVDSLRFDLAVARGRARELQALVHHHVRTAFMLGLGIGVVAVMAFGWMVMWLK